MKLQFLYLLTILFIAATAISAQTSGNSDAKIITSPKFVLSAEDLAAGISGQMRVAILVDKFGNVTKSAVFVAPASPCNGNNDSRVRRIMAEAEEWVRSYKFKPAFKNDQPVEAELAITLELEDKTKTTDPNAPRTISAGQVNGKAKDLPAPRYPVEARPDRIGGIVTVKVTVDEKGNVVSAQALDGPPILREASREAACRASFAPTRLEGKYVRFVGTLQYNFVPR